jgi:hypothetical protein
MKLTITHLQQGAVIKICDTNQLKAIESSGDLETYLVDRFKDSIKAVLIPLEGKNVSTIDIAISHTSVDSITLLSDV